MRKIHTSKLRENDVVLKLDDENRVKDICTLKTRIPGIGCNGFHFITISNQLVCYGPGIVTIKGQY